MKTSAVLFLSGLVGVTVSAQPVFHDSKAPQVSFAASEIRHAFAPNAPSADRALRELPSDTSPLRVVIAGDAAESKAIAQRLGVAPPRNAGPQCYAIRRIEQRGRVTIAILGADPSGAMYGGLDVAEAVRLGRIQETRDSDHSPHIAQRGIKFNIPLDRRTPSYSDHSDSGQANIPEMWSMDFWHTMFDEMARHRFNEISLWNLHPFPSIVKVPEYADIVLNDVWGNREPFDLKFNMNSNVMSQAFQLGNVAVVKRLTIDDKIRFWREVMQYAKDRGIDVYWSFGQNIHVGSEFMMDVPHARQQMGSPAGVRHGAGQSETPAPE